MEWVGAAGRGTGLEAEVQMRDGCRKHILGGDADLARPACGRGALRRKEGGPGCRELGELGRGARRPVGSPAETRPTKAYFVFKESCGRST